VLDGLDVDGHDLEALARMRRAPNNSPDGVPATSPRTIARSPTTKTSGRWRQGLAQPALNPASSSEGGVKET